MKRKSKKSLPHLSSSLQRVQNQDQSDSSQKSHDALGVRSVQDSEASSMPVSKHLPIMVEPIVKALTEPFLALPSDAEPHTLVDVTLGGGGHTAAFLEAFSSHPQLARHKILAIDQDLGAVERARQKFAKWIAQGCLRVEHLSFGAAGDLVRSVRTLGLLADLGFSSDQMEDPARGLSFLSEGPLDMRLDPSQGRSCQELLLEISEEDLEKILREYGEERFSRRIAQLIVQRVHGGEVPQSPRELARWIVHALPAFARHGRIHAATRSFQALRIAVNDEIGQLNELLNHVILGVSPGGRVAIISFHSLEDRLVKRRFRDAEDFTPLTKKPLVADEEEVRANPRSRSAKLRIAAKG